MDMGDLELDRFIEAAEQGQGLQAGVGGDDAVLGPLFALRRSNTPSAGCADAEWRIASMSEDRLPSAEVAELTAHLAGCPDCSRVAARSALSEPVEGAEPTSRGGWHKPVGIALAAAAVFVVGIVAGWQLRGPQQATIVVAEGGPAPSMAPEVGGVVAPVPSPSTPSEMSAEPVVSPTVAAPLPLAPSAPIAPEPKKKSKSEILNPWDSPPTARRPQQGSASDLVDPFKASTPPHGYLNVSCKPYCSRIYVDGKNHGSSPQVRIRVAAGSHQVSGTRDGYRAARRAITVRRGKTTTVVLTLRPQDLLEF